MISNSSWNYFPLSEACIICDSYRRPVNTKERSKRIEGKKLSDLFPYYGATGQVGYIDDYLIDGDYVLLGEDGAPFLNTFAKKAYIIRGKAWVNNHAHILQSKTDNKFLCYFLNYFDYKGYVCGTTRLKLTQGQMRNIPVPVPPIEEQQRIVTHIEELFSELDSAVETLQKAKQQLEVYRQAVLKEAFDGLNESVTMDTLAVMIDPQPSHRTPAVYDGGIPYIGIGDIDYSCDRIKFSEARKVSPDLLEEHRQRYRIEKGDFIMGKIGTIGKPYRLPLPQDYLLSANVILIKPDCNIIIPDFLYWQFSSWWITSQLIKGSTATSQPAFGIKKARLLNIKICGIEKQRQIVNQIYSKLSICDSIEKTINEALQQAEAMRQSILKKAFEGRL